MQIRIIFILISIIVLMAGCSSYDFSNPIVQQGNLLPLAKVKQLKKGMSKDEVSTLMGTSLLSPVFTNSRWDYAYTLRKRGGALKKRHISLYFNGDYLVRIEPESN